VPGDKGEEGRGRKRKKEEERGRKRKKEKEKDNAGTQRSQSCAERRRYG
jgi:hypothetical protein